MTWYTRTGILRRRSRGFALAVAIAGCSLVPAPFASANGAGASIASTPTTKTATSLSTSAVDKALTWDPSNYSVITVTIDGVEQKVRWYKEVCYVANPVEAAPTQYNNITGTITISDTRCGYESMNVFVPQSAWRNPDAAIYMAVHNEGWFMSYISASVTDGESFDSSTDNVGAALKHGYVFIDLASRDSDFISADGTDRGKSPEVVVDAKAAVRYLRLNDSRMPGSAERIIINGGSGGGGLASILGSSGNSADYYPYLADIGAAGITRRGGRYISTLDDDVFAVNAYCPITDLGNADVIYEWLYTSLNTRADVGQDSFPEDSKELAAEFAAYEKSLGLTNPDGTRLTAKNMMATLRSEIIRSANHYLASDPANTIPAYGENFVITGVGGATKSYTNNWIWVNQRTRRVTNVDMKKYLDFVATQQQLKSTPSFDIYGVNGQTGHESIIFGTGSQEYSNFTEFSWEHNSVAGDGTGYDDTGLHWKQFIKTAAGKNIVKQVNMINPMKYISTAADTAPYWYVRAGTRDRDTAFTVSLNLARALQSDKSVKDVNYRLAWNQPHAGNYDVPEAMAWIARVLKHAGSPTRHAG
ncbi:MAG: subtype B tannase [Nocardioides sp.]|uniref:subtype B tannase n=1 Tax=Nocardioides sp. TaxID=35761 RepID=UPI0039E47880